jgi:hypothetical protein
MLLLILESFSLTTVSSQPRAGKTLTHQCLYHQPPSVLSRHRDVILSSDMTESFESLSLSLLLTPPAKEVSYLFVPSNKTSGSSSTHSSQPSVAVLLSLAQTTYFIVHFGDGFVTPRHFNRSLHSTFSRFCNQTSHSPRTLEDEDDEESSHLHNLTTSAISHINIQFTQLELGTRFLEEYTLDITNSRVSILTYFFKGLLNALSSLGQLIDSPFPLHSLPIKIHDYPNLKDLLTQEKSGEILLNVAKHYLPIPTLCRIIDAMRAAKFNLLRLHVMDSMSLGIQFYNTSSLSFSLSTLGDFSLNRFTDGSPAIYTKDDLSFLINYAANQGIDIRPRVTIPSGVFASSQDFSHLFVNCSVTTSDSRLVKKIYAINPLHPHTLPLIRALLHQVMSLFPHPVLEFDMNKDDSTRCWLASALVTSNQTADKMYETLTQAIAQIAEQSYGKEMKLKTEATPLFPGEYTHGIDFTNAECHIWPSAVHLSLWGNQTLVKVDATNQSYSVLHKPTSPAYRLALVRFHYYLKRIGLRTAEITLYPNNLSASLQKKKKKKGIVASPIILKNEVLLLKHLLQDSSTGTANYRISSKCPSIADNTQRPIPSSTEVNSNAYRNVQMAFLNVADGGRDRSPMLHHFLTQKANQGVAFVDLCELNGWQAVPEDQPNKVSTMGGRLAKKRKMTSLEHYPIVKKNAALAGFAYSYVTNIPKQPFNIGLVSSFPFEVLGVYGPPSFQRGCLHVYFKDIHLHAFITHLHAHDASLRELETLFLSSLVKPIIQKQVDTVIVMGDMNSLFLGDSDIETHHSLWMSLFQTNQHPTVQRLKKKFCYENSSRINYQPLQNLIDVGMRDACTAYCETMTDFNECYTQWCVYSEPTLFNPEVRAVQQSIVCI